MLEISLNASFHFWYFFHLIFPFWEKSNKTGTMLPASLAATGKAKNKLITIKIILLNIILTPILSNIITKKNKKSSKYYQKMKNN